MAERVVSSEPRPPSEREHEIALRADAATAGATLARYQHGGGRLGIWEVPGTLVADFFDEENREFYGSARDDVLWLLDQLAAERADRERLQPLAELGEAWAEAEAAMPEWYSFELTVSPPDAYYASAWDATDSDYHEAIGDTPVAALRALAQKFRDTAP